MFVYFANGILGKNDYNINQDKRRGGEVVKVAGIQRDSITNGSGVRDVLFTQGCLHHCEGCHNPDTWNIAKGTHWLKYELILEFSNSENDITISGGEPLLQIGEVIEFMRTMNQCYGKRFWLYTGFTYEEISPSIREELSKYVDVLVDGKFIKELADSSLLFRGSSNQRLIDLGESVKQNKIILWEDNIYETIDKTLG